jgi:low-density lipoprotein receptor class B
MAAARALGLGVGGLLVATATGCAVLTGIDALQEEGSDGGNQVGSDGSKDSSSAGQDGGSQDASDGSPDAGGNDACPEACVLASGVSGMKGRLAVDSNNAYFATVSTIDSVSLAGGAVRELATGLTDVNYLAVDPQYVYYSVEYPVEAGAMYRVPLTGGTPAVIAPNRQGPNGVTVKDGILYWAEQGNGTVNGAVVSLPVGGGTPSIVAGGQVGPEQLAVDSANTYFGNLNNAGTTVVEAPLLGGPPLTLATVGVPTGIAIDTTNVYFTDTKDGTVNQVPKGGGAVILLASSPHSDFLASDGTNVYWTDAAQGTLQKIAVGAHGSVVTMLSGLQDPEGIAVDVTSVYCAERGSGTILRLNK